MGCKGSKGEEERPGGYHSGRSGSSTCSGLGGERKKKWIEADQIKYVSERDPEGLQWVALVGGE